MISSKKTSLGTSSIGGPDRESAQTMDVLRFGGCELRMPVRELWREGRRQALRKRVFDLLVYLIRRRPATAAHAEIARAVWGRSDVRPSVIAQAVLHARRAVGDDIDEPILIQSVRGVGYRFAAVPQVGVDAAGDPGGDDDISTVRAAVDEAQRAADRNDHEVALFLSENAIDLARQIGANALGARAMAIASWAALLKGSMPLASRYAFKALRLAEAEEHHAVAALARVRAAHVLFAAGDLQGALEILQRVRLHADVPPDDRTALLCETLAGMICGDLRHFKHARDWLERALRTSLLLEPERRGLRERIELVNLHLKRAEAAELDGETSLVREAFETALALNESILADCTEIGDQVQRMCWFGNQGIALCGLGRVDEAWRFAEKASQMLDEWPHKTSPWYITHRGELSIQWASMLHASSRNAEAIECLAAAISVAETSGNLGQVMRMASLAAKASEALREFASALKWARQAQQAHQKQGQERLAQLACAYQASHDHDELTCELIATRTELSSARSQLQQLREQLERSRQQDAASALLDPPEAFDAALRRLFEEAKARDLPCLVGVLTFAPGRPSAPWDTPAGRQSMLLASAARIRRHLGAACTRVRSWPDQALAFTIEGVGVGRGLQICEELEGRLNAPGIFDEGDPPKRHLRITLCDLSRHDAFEAASRSIGQEHAAPRG